MSKSDASGPLLAFGAHPDDIEFACGAVIANATRAGQAAHFVVCSRGEAGTAGRPEEREKEAKRGAEILGATIEFVQLDGDAHLDVRAVHAVKLAAIFRRVRPSVVLAPSLVENQHPDHANLGRLVLNASRLARYGGIRELKDLPRHVTPQLLYYAVSPDAEPRDITPVYIDVSAPEVVAQWQAAMDAHASQTQARNYVEMQMTRARMNGMRCGVQYAVALFPTSPIVTASLASLTGGGNRF
jgi:LmbE family N-acetylglucosaminyl deacetylase